MATSNSSNPYRLEPEETGALPRITLFTMFRLGLFQIALGMMSVLMFGVLNRVLIRELGVPGTIGGIILALTLFVAPARVWFGQLSDTKRLWGYHRTGYVWIGAFCLALLAAVSVQVMWKVGDSLGTVGWTTPTYLWTGLLALIFALYGLAVSACSTPFTTLLVDVSDEDNRSKLVGMDWSMLIGGTIIGAITIGVLLKKLTLNAPIAELQASINRLFAIVPIVVLVLAFLATWGIEKKYSRYASRLAALQAETASAPAGSPEPRIGLGRAWQILTASRQTRLFFTFLGLMTIGLFMQDPVLENYGGDVFAMEIGATASLNAFWGTGTLIGLLISGFLLTPRIGKRNTAKLGGLLVVASLVGVIGIGFTHSQVGLKLALLMFGLASGIVTTGALSLMLDLTAAATAGTFIGAWGLAQAFARGIATVSGGVLIDLGKRLFSDPVLSYGLVFVMQGVAMLFAVWCLRQVNVQEFRTSAKQAIAAVLEAEID
ncbi:MAG TPA: BCD family MFS transporter [Coleofasciculaceae cyanobacterium]